MMKFFIETIQACPVCELGTKEAVTFIILIFGTFVGAMIFLLLAFNKRKGWRNSEHLKGKALEAENEYRV
jgi:hypothetical protein